MTDLNDGFGPFVPNQPLNSISPEISIILSDRREASTYGDAIEDRAKEELRSIRGKTNEEAKLVQQESELKNRIEKCYTKSRNASVRAKYKENRDRLKSQLAKVQDELTDFRLSKNKS